MAREARSACVIQAPLWVVWNVLINLAEYPSWNPFIVHAAPPTSSPSKGTLMAFNVRWIDGGRVTSRERVTIFDSGDAWPPTRAVWAYTYVGPIATSRMVCATRTHALIALNDDTTHYTTVERFTGWARCFVPLRKVQAGFDAQTAALKQRAERPW